jgi:hypothetical protein
MTTFTTEDREKASKDNQYCIYTEDSHFLAVLDYIKENNLEFSAHLNRTRFWVPENKLYDFMKSWGSVCSVVPSYEDVSTGQMIGEWDEWKSNKDMI